MDDKKFDITSYELDQLKEIVNIGASHAGDVLSKMVGKKVTLTVPEAKIDEVPSLVKYIGDVSKKATAVNIKISGDTVGMMLFIFPGNSGHKIAKLITNDKNDENEEVDRKDMSALREVGNILAGSYLSAMAQFLKINLLYSVPKVHTDTLCFIIDEIVNQEEISDIDIFLLFKVSLTICDENTEAQLYMLSDSKFTSKILEITKKAFGM